MSTAHPDVAAAIDSAARQLLMIDACGPDWADGDQVRFIRVFIEEGIGALAQADRAQSDIIAECVMLAGENMQDARLGILEQPSQEGGGGLFGFLINLGIMLALELLLVSTAVYAVPALVALASGRMQARKARQLVSAIAHQQDTEGRYRTSLESLGAVGKEIARKRVEIEGLWGRRAEGSFVYLDYKKAVRRWKQLENEYALGMAALERSVELAKRASAATRNAASDPMSHLTSEDIRKFMNGALAHTMIGRVAENTAATGTEKIVQAVAGSAVAAPPPVFQTSTLLGRFLAEIRRERNEAEEEWSRTRFHIRCLTDEDLVGSEIAQELFFRIHYEQSPAMVQDFSFAERTFLVLGIEGALWLAWLCHIKALGSEAASGRLVPGGLRVGEIEGDLLITDLGDVPGVANGISYPGLVRISDKHAEYLYTRFARTYYIANPGASPEFATPISAGPGAVSGTVKFDYNRYDEVASISPTSFGLLDRDRLVRVAEMKLLVILYFRLLVTKPDAISGSEDAVGAEARKVLRELLGLKTGDDVIKSYLSSLSPVGEPGPPAVSRSDDTPVVELANTLATAGGLERKWLVGDARSQLEAAVGSIEMKIATYPLLYAPATAGLSADRGVAGEALRAIELEQQQVSTRHAAFLALAAEQADMIAEVETQFGDRVRAATNWSPVDTGEGTWKFYPSAQAAAPSA